MRKVLYSLVGLALVAGLAAAQDPEPDDGGPGQLEIKVESPEALKEGSFAEFTLGVKMEKDDKVAWEVTPAPIRARRYGSVFVVAGVKGTTYTVKADVVNFTKKGGKWLKGSVEYTFGGKAPTPVVTPPPDPVTPPAKAHYYFAVVRADGPASPEFTKAMQDPAWAALKAAGHQVKDFTVTDAHRLNIETGPTPLPVVVTLVFSADGKSSLVARPAVPLPTAGTDILKLPDLR